jgi:hypothetical protein
MEIVELLIGKDEPGINAYQMGLRALVVFLSALLMLKDN